MGYTLTPFVVDISKIAAVLGSKDESLFDLLTKDFKDEFDEIDALGDDYEEEKEVEKRGGIKSVDDALRMMRDLLLGQGPLHSTAPDTRDEHENSGTDTKESRPPCASTADALRHLIMGDEFDRRVGFKYGYVLRCLCQYFGEELLHDNWCDLRSCHNWFQELDTTLRSIGVPAETLSISGHLCERGAPIPIPKYSGFPSIGYLTVAEIEVALKSLCAARIDDIGEEEEEPWLPEGLDDVRCWLQTCSAAKCDLVCFYS